jgi:hypothetical protein
MKASLTAWLDRAEELGMDEESIIALFTVTLREHKREAA